MAGIAIIGGGGCTDTSAARGLRLRRPDLGVLLLEVKTVGNDASGRNGGQHSRKGRLQRLSPHPSGEPGHARSGYNTPDVSPSISR